jgi:hypothetical protein
MLEELNDEILGIQLTMDHVTSLPDAEALCYMVAVLNTMDENEVGAEAHEILRGSDTQLKELFIHGSGLA